MSNRYSKHVDECDRLRKELKKAKIENDNLRSDADRLRKERDDKSATIIDLEETVEGLESTGRRLRKEREIHRKKADESGVETEQLTSTCRSLRKDCKDQGRTIMRLETEVARHMED